MTGHTRGALARPDGYTITMVTVEINMLHWRGLTNISYRDFEPVGMLNRDATAVFVRQDAPWRNLDELEDRIREHPGEVKASGTAQGGSWHLGFAGWLDHEGIDPGDAIWVSINGAAPSLQELIAGGVEVACCSLPEAQALLDAGPRPLPGRDGGPAGRAVPGRADVQGTGRGVGVHAPGEASVFPKVARRRSATRLATALENVARSDEFRELHGKCGF